MSFHHKVLYPLLSANGSTLIIGVLAITLLWLAKKSSAAVKHWIAMLSLVAMLLIPVSDTLVPTVHSILIPTENKVYILTDPAPVTFPPSTQQVPLAPINPEVKDLPPPAGVGDVARQEDYRKWESFLYRINFTAIGIGISIALMISGYLICWRRFTNTRNQLPVGWSHLINRAAKVMAIDRTKLRVKISSRCSVPLIIGLIRPKIILPKEALNWQPLRIHTSLCHEIAHLQRRDLYTQFIGRLICAIFWWNPVAWWLLIKMRSYAESACDDRVVTATGEPEDYAAELVSIARLHRRRFFTSGEVSILSKSDLSDRVEAILDRKLNRKRIGTAAALLGALGLTGVAASSLIAIDRVPQESPLLNESKQRILKDIQAAIETAEKHSPDIIYSGEQLIESQGNDEIWRKQPAPSRFRAYASWRKPTAPTLSRLDRTPQYYQSGDAPYEFAPEYGTIWFDGKTEHSINWRRSIPHRSKPGIGIDFRHDFPLINSTTHRHAFFTSDSYDNLGYLKKQITRLLDNKDLELRVLEDDWQGRKVIKLETLDFGRRYRWWLDPQKNYALLGVTNTDWQDNKASWVYTVKIEDLREVQPGFWFPGKVTLFRTYRHGVVDSFGNYNVVGFRENRTTTTLRDIQVVPGGHSPDNFAVDHVLEDVRKQKYRLEQEPTKGDHQGSPLNSK